MYVGEGVIASFMSCTLPKIQPQVAQAGGGAAYIDVSRDGSRAVFKSSNTANTAQFHGGALFSHGGETNYVMSLIGIPPVQ